MIIVDTNVISEPLRRAPDPGVIRWLDAQAVETLWLTSISLAEIRYGIAVLPRGRRRRSLHERVEREVLPLFADRVLGFDSAASGPYANLRAAARTAGEAIGDFDALIAAIAKAHGATVATRDTGPFAASGVPVINPFTPEFQ